MENITYDNWSSKWALIFLGISFLFACIDLAFCVFIFNASKTETLGSGGAVFILSFFLQLFIYDKRHKTEKVE